MLPVGAVGDAGVVLITGVLVRDEGVAVITNQGSVGAPPGEGTSVQPAISKMSATSCTTRCL